MFNSDRYTLEPNSGNYYFCWSLDFDNIRNYFVQKRISILGTGRKWLYLERTKEIVVL